MPLPPAAALKRVLLLGGGARAELLLHYADAGDSTHHQRRLAAYDLFPQLDSRPHELFLAGQMASHVLNDPTRRERYMEAAITRARSAGNYGLRRTYFSVLDRRQGISSRLSELPSVIVRPTQLGFEAGAMFLYVSARGAELAAAN